MNDKNDKHITIDTLSPGQDAVVDYVEKSPLSGRLRDLGIVSGTPIKCLYKAPLGDPSAYSIRGAVIALRREDSRFVIARRGGYPNG